MGVLALLLGATGWFVLRGPLAGRLPRVAARGAGDVALAPARAVPAATRARIDPPAFEGLADVSWAPEGDGLWVVLSLDGDLPADSLRRLRLEAEHPREVIQFLGARRGYTPALLAVDSPLLERIRVAYHPAGSAEGSGVGDELRVVLDLPSSAVVVRSVHSDSRSLRLLLGRQETLPGASASAVTPSTPPAQ